MGRQHKRFQRMRLHGPFDDSWKHTQVIFTIYVAVTSSRIWRGAFKKKKKKKNLYITDDIYL